MTTENKIILSACNELELSTEVFMSGLRERAYMDAKRICVGLLLESEDMTLQEVATINRIIAPHLSNASAQHLQQPNENRLGFQKEKRQN